MSGDTQLSDHLDTPNGRLALTYILNRWISLHGVSSDAGDREAFRLMCYALHETKSTYPLPN